jgi:hypothetical protein
MSEEVKPPDETSSPGGNLAPDELLASLVNLANRFDIGMSITLNVEGLLVTGQMISGKKYYEEFANQLRRAKAGALRQVIDELADAYAELGGELYPLHDFSKDEESEGEGENEGIESEGSKDDEPRIPKGFIHLRNARFTNPAGLFIPTGSGMLWRGRLVAVSGFTMGELSAG